MSDPTPDITLEAALDEAIGALVKKGWDEPGSHERSLEIAQAIQILARNKHAMAAGPGTLREINAAIDTFMETDLGYDDDLPVYDLVTVIRQLAAAQSVDTT